jgi:hypothetical protein
LPKLNDIEINTRRISDFDTANRTKIECISRNYATNQIIFAGMGPVKESLVPQKLSSNPDEQANFLDSRKKKDYGIIEITEFRLSDSNANFKRTDLKGRFRTAKEAVSEANKNVLTSRR